jgi:hypothetical protein
MLRLIRRALRKEHVVPRIGPQGEQYDALQMERRWQEKRGRFAKNVIKKAGHTSHPFLDDPYG